MADWYCGSVSYAAVTQWAALTTYAVGALRRQLAAPAAGSERCFRASAITTGVSGAAEPTWNLTKGATTTDSGVTWTEVTGNSTYNWTAPHARIANAIASGWPAAGDRIFVASNHAYSVAGAITYNPAVGGITTPLQVICVNAAGSVPPVSADLLYTATETTTGANQIGFTLGGVYMTVEGVTFFAATGANTSAFQIHTSSSNGGILFNQCALVIGSTGAGFIDMNTSGVGNGPIVFKYVLVQFGATTQGILVRKDFTWLNTPSAISGVNFPTNLFIDATVAVGTVRLDGVDLSALGSGKTIVAAQSGSGVSIFQLVNCKLGASVTVAATPTSPDSRVDVIISDSGATGYNQQSYQLGGNLTTETTFTRSGGASDGVQAISWKVVTNANGVNFGAVACFPIAIWNTATGVSVTATVEIENGGTTLTNADVYMEIEYLGSASFPVSSVATTAPVDVLAAAANLTTSTATWNGSLGSAVKQKMSVAFTPQMVGFIRAKVYVNKASLTVYIDPVLTLT